MTYDDFLDRLISEAIEGVNRDYTGTTDNQKDKKEGSLAGLEECRGKKPDELVKAYDEALELQQEAYIVRVENYWWFRTYCAEIEFVINVVSAGTGRKLLPHLPTALGLRRANEIMNSKPEL
jgi:hypothetical protein